MLSLINRPSSKLSTISMQFIEMRFVAFDVLGSPQYGQVVSKVLSFRSFFFFSRST